MFRSLSMNLNFLPTEMKNGGSHDTIFWGNLYITGKCEQSKDAYTLERNSSCLKMGPFLKT